MYARTRLVARYANSFDQLNTGCVIADLLITSVRTEEFDGPTFNRRLKRFKNKVLQPLFSRGISIVTRSDANRLHCHCAVETTIPVDSFDWLSFEESERYYQLYKTFGDKSDLRFYRYYSTKYLKSLPVEWRQQLHRMRAQAKHYGLGRLSVVPVRKNMTAYKYYLMGNIPRRRDPRDKGMQYLTTWGLDSVKDFQVLNRHTRAFRERLKTFSMGLQLTSENYNIILRDALGTHWFCRCEELIRDIHQLTPDQQIRYRQMQTTINMYRLRSDYEY